MIETYKDNQAYRTISLILIYFSLLAFVYLTYVNYFNVFSRHFQNRVLTDMIVKIHGNRPNALIIKAISLSILASAVMTHSSAKAITEEKKKRAGIIGGLMLLLYLIQGFTESFYGNFGFVSILIHTVLFMSGLFLLLEWRKKLVEDLRKDRRNINESQFDQAREKVENEYSVNIPYKYFYRGQELRSWINVVNPFRATLVGGTPGAGKSFAVIEEFFRQFISKGFTGVFYDFKYPTLSRKVYNYMLWYQGRFKVAPKFFVVNFDDPEYSHRCNPINVDSLQTIADAEENTKVLMLNINKTWIEKEGDFFTDSANVFTSMLMWYLKILVKKYDYDICSFPHLVALSTYESTEILFLLMQSYPELKPKMKPFSEALEKGALEQLAGQVASAGVALSKISSPELNYILTGDDFSFDLNNPLSPKLLALGNNPDRQITYGAPLGLILTKLSKTLNRQGQLPSVFAVDEFPTVYIRGIDNLIATARSNKVATLLGFQSFAQIVADYGKEISDKINRICGTRIMGQMMDDDAEIISKSIGRQKILTQSFSYSAADISESQQVTLEDIVPASYISQFSQGTFTGVVADDFKNKEDNKVFYGEIIPPMELKEREDDIPLPKIYSFSPDNLVDIVAEYIGDEKDKIDKLIEILTGMSYGDLQSLFDVFTSESQFYQFIIDQNKLPYSDYKSFFELILFKKHLSELLAKKLKNESLEAVMGVDEAKKFIFDCIYDGFEHKYRVDFLESHTNEIYNDIYKIIGLEIKELDLISHIKKNNTLKQQTINFFMKIYNSDRLNSPLIKKEYENFIIQLQN